MKNLFDKFSRWAVRGVLTVLMASSLMACAAGLVQHGFSFDARRDSPGVRILDYRYGNTKQSGARADEDSVREGTVGQYVGTSGEMMVGDSLYVKWRLASDGKSYEDVVDLKSRLPRDIHEHEIYFIVKGRQLFVYLVTPEMRPPDMGPNGPRKYEYRKVITLSTSIGHEVVNK